MTRPIDPTEVLCKDGGSFSVHRMGGRIAIFASFRDRLAVDAGLARYTTFHEPGDACAEHAGMPVEVVREYPNLSINPDAGLGTSLGGWEAIHAVEVGLITPGNPKRSTYARATDAGWRSVGKVPPTPEQLKAARKAARC